MGRSYYVFSPGVVRRKENTIVIEIEKEDRIERKILPVEDVEQIFFMSDVNINSRFLEFASKNEITLHFFNHYGYYTGSFFPRKRSISGFVLVKQVEHYLDDKKRLALASKFVSGALHNIRRILEKRGYNEAREKIKKYEEELKSAKSIVELMSIEAHSRKIYYSVWNSITGWELVSREIRPPSNELNALISFGNSLVYSYVLKEIYHTPLNPAISYLHEPSEKRFSLALDISEIFKPIFVDRLIFRLINQGILKKDEHFEQDLEGVFLNETGRKIFIQKFDELMNETILHRALGRKVRYQSLIRLEIYKILKHILGDKEYKPLKVWW